MKVIDLTKRISLYGTAFVIGFSSIGVSSVSAADMSESASRPQELNQAAPMSKRSLSTQSTDTVPQRPEGVIQPETPFLKLPFVQALGHKLNVTQGWGGEATEDTIIGEGTHAAIDFEGYPYGAPVVAAASGWARYSYQRIIMPVDYNDPLSGRHVKYIDVGAGLFVEITHDQKATGVPGSPRWVTQYVHLAQVAPGIKYAEATPSDTTTIDGKTIQNYTPSGIMQPESELIKPSKGTRVKQGDVIGYMGDTGIGANWYDNWNTTLKTVLPRNRLVTPPWDPQGAYKVVSPTWATQLHFNLYAGRGVDGKQGQQNRVDSFDLYANSDLGILPGHTYDNPYMRNGKPYAGPTDSKTAFIRDGHNNLLFAR